MLPCLVAIKIPEINTQSGNYIRLLKITLFSTIPCANHETTDELSIVIREYLYHFMEFIDTMDGEYKRDAAKVIHEYLYHFMEFIDTMDGERKRDAAKVIHEYLYHFMEFIDTMDGEYKRDAAKVIHEYLYHFMEFIDTMISFHGIHRHNGW